jgi:hypothetical protein
LSLRQEANRSTPSLLSQPSPPRRSPSPGLRQSSGNPFNDWTRRNGSSGNTSPARSTFSLASTVNLHAAVTGTSNITTTGKLAHSSPLYYDYTEDFEGDGYQQSAETLGLPPQFNIEQSVPEERPMGAERPPSSEPRLHPLGNGLRPSSAPTPTIPKLSDGSRNNKTVLPSERQFKAIQPSLDNGKPDNYPPVKQVENPIDKETIRLSGLGYGAQGSSTHVEEAFGLLPTKSLEISVSRTDLEAIAGTTNVRGAVAQEYKNTEMQFMWSSSRRGNTHPPRLSSLPSVRSRSRTDAIASTEGEQSTSDKLLHLQTSQDLMHLSQPSTPLVSPPKPAEVELGHDSRNTAPASSSQSRYRSSSGFRSIDTGFTELADLIKTLEDSNRARNPERESAVFTGPEKTPMLSSSIPDKSMFQTTQTNYGSTLPVSSFNSSGAKDGRVGTQVQPLKRTQPCSEGPKTEASTLGTYERTMIPNSSHQMALRAIPRSGSPMLAPKPISPARQLKLKNSVPQLMKALPPLPPEPLISAIPSPNRSKSPVKSVPSRLSPRSLELGALPMQGTLYQAGKKSAPRGPRVPVESGSTSAQPPCAEQPPNQNPPISQFPPKLRLNMRNSASLPPLSSSNPRPYNMEESYPSSTPDPNAHLTQIVQAEKPSISKPPKFRLKVTRASGSTYGTVRVNRESGESKSTAGFHLRNHKDLFASTAGIDNIFRQVSQHIHSRKASAASSNTGSKSQPAPMSLLRPNSYFTSTGTSPTTDLNISRPQATKPLPPTEVLSVFSDDSSRIEGHSSMRGRLLNLRARIAVPCVDRTRSQSYDDLAWRDRNGTGTRAPRAKTSASNLHSTKESTGKSQPSRHFARRMQHRKLKEKVQGWLRGARSAIVSRMKSRSTTRSGQVKVRG